MALVQTAAQLRPIARSVGITDQRSDEIHALAAVAPGADAKTTAELQRVVNSIGFYNEHADRLVAAGVTFTV